MNLQGVFELLLFGVAGFGVGALHFAGLWHNVQAYSRPSGAGLAALLHGGRILVTAALFCWVATCGALPLLCALAGCMLARPLITRMVVRPA